MISLTEWVKQSEIFAYGFLGLKPWEFGEMTMGEFKSMVYAYHQAEKAKDRKFAYFVAWTMTPYCDDMEKMYKTIYYGLHPNEKPLPEEEKKAFCEQFNL